ncbi:YodC family protein [Laribacter hongkongensis]|uniref:YodC family protein n=1 Tax=Laribacter hongkongensis TaxID=168471 RepID=UPI0009DBAFC2|nr:DUF2158 domain-containing protein [Laribacter hongkongensis]
MNDDNFKVGDVVRLKSGGPRMTIQRQDREGWLCVWFTSYEADKASYHSFPTEALALVKE